MDGWMDRQTDSDSSLSEDIKHPISLFSCN